MSTPAEIDAEAVEWAESVMYLEALVEHGWSFEFTPNKKDFPGCEGLTLQDSKTIIMHWPTGRPNYPLILHEIAHARMGRGGHDSDTFHEFQRLVEKYMDVKPYNQLEKAKDEWDRLRGADDGSC